MVRFPVTAPRYMPLNRFGLRGLPHQVEEFLASALDFLKRADNYIKTYKADQVVPESRSLPPEECETFMLRRKRDKEELELHTRQGRARAAQDRRARERQWPDQVLPPCERAQLRPLDVGAAGRRPTNAAGGELKDL